MYLMQYNPFFINSNLCIEPNDLSSFGSFMDSVAGNTGNSYITYSLIKACFGSLDKVNHIQNIYTYDAVANGSSMGYGPIQVAFFRTTPGFSAQAYAFFSAAEFIGRSIGGLVRYRTNLKPEKRRVFVYI